MVSAVENRGERSEDVCEGKAVRLEEAQLGTAFTNYFGIIVTGRDSVGLKDDCSARCDNIDRVVDSITELRLIPEFIAELRLQPERHSWSEKREPAVSDALVTRERSNIVKIFPMARGCWNN